MNLARVPSPCPLPHPMGRRVGDRRVGPFNVAPDDTEFGAPATLRLQRLVEVRISAARVAFVDVVPLLGGEIGRLNVALRVVVLVSRLRIDAA